MPKYTRGGTLSPIGRFAPLLFLTSHSGVHHGEACGDVVQGDRPGEERAELRRPYPLLRALRGLHGRNHALIATHPIRQPHSVWGFFFHLCIFSFIFIFGPEFMSFYLDQRKSNPRRCASYTICRVVFPASGIPVVTCCSLFGPKNRTVIG